VKRKHTDLHILACDRPCLRLKGLLQGRFAMRNDTDDCCAEMACNGKEKRQDAHHYIHFPRKQRTENKSRNKMEGTAKTNLRKRKGEQTPLSVCNPYR
jgi:hypothetical protein